jgi:chitin disaccharide deacetylase
MKILIVNADDFGLAPAVNQGILDAYLAGSVTSTTLLVNAQFSVAAADLARAHPGLAVGLHFNLTLGAPICDPQAIATLVDAEGRFHPRKVLARRLLLGRVRRDHVDRELAAQFERLHAFGVASSHVDSHQHIHGFPLVFDSVASLSAQYRLPMRMPWILRLPQKAGSIGRRVRQALLRRMLARNARHWASRVKWNDGLGSIFDLGAPAGALGRQHYEEILAAAPEGIFELMVHPARDAREVEGLTRIGPISESEWQFLRGSDLGRIAADRGFELRSFKTAFT